MFTKQIKDGYRRVLDGISMKTLAHGKISLMVEFRLQKGALLPVHHHPHEQTGYLISGRMQLEIGGIHHDVMPGDSWCIHGTIPHGAIVMEDSVAIEVFSPVREDYLP